jgi:uncharacterized coiled-coil protein SlyX
MTDSVPLTYKELAERLGISPDSARIKAKRRKWAVIPGNHPSEPVRVLVPVAVLEGERSPERSGGERSGGALPNSTGEISALRAHVETLKEQLARAQAERESDQHHSRALTDRLDQLHRDHTATAAELARVQAEHRAIVTQHQAEVDRLCAELEQVRQPWWRRLIGAGR